ncbi:hypothetical protein DJ021_11075 [Phenylobacterium hankyongense]|uniref:Uncharacterized protein n=1 Tax=Phenylobacterium hankyongense TaxID=1813876 RepID=A0A328B077_9CAUL|nr:hypothetical protein DJ021_11075 [Phenylobacterium hankyongense]
MLAVEPATGSSVRTVVVVVAVRVRPFLPVRAQTGVAANIVLSVSSVVAPLGAVKSTDMSVPPE